MLFEQLILCTSSVGGATGLTAIELVWAFHCHSVKFNKILLFLFAATASSAVEAQVQVKCWCSRKLCKNMINSPCIISSGLNPKRVNYTVPKTQTLSCEFHMNWKQKWIITTFTQTWTKYSHNVYEIGTITETIFPLLYCVCVEENMGICYENMKANFFHLTFWCLYFIVLQKYVQKLTVGVTELFSL